MVGTAFDAWHDSGMSSRHAPRSPYRFQRIPLGRPWCEAIRLDNGRALILRPIVPEDASRLRRSFRELTPEEVRFRFFHPIRELSPELARSLSTLDPEQAFALVVIEARPPDRARLGAVARVALDPDGRAAEFALVVGGEIAGYGLGRYLLQRLTEWCRKKHLEIIYGRIMTENDRMLRLAGQLGFELRHEPDAPGVVRATRRLRTPPADD